MGPLISVIVPVYNVEPYLRQCIESIQSQTYRKLQIILVDDGSTDGSGDICDEYAKHDDRIVIIHQPNGGLVRARKVGLEKATGEYIGFVDGDDYVESQMYEVLADEMVKTGADFVHTGYWQNQSCQISFQREEIELSPHRASFLGKAVFSEGAYISPSIWSKLFKAQLIQKCYAKVPNQISYGEDVVSLCACLLEAERILLLDQAFYHYRVRTSSLTHRDAVILVKDEVSLYEALCDLFHRYHLYESVEVGLKRNLLWTLFGIIKNEMKDIYPIQRYRYADIENIRHKRLVLYGAGMVGQSYYTQISRYQSCQIVAWVDRHPPRLHDVDINIDSPEVLLKIEYDLILIALKSKEDAIDVKQNLIAQGIERDKIFWSVPEKLF